MKWYDSTKAPRHGAEVIIKDRDMVLQSAHYDRHDGFIRDDGILAGMPIVVSCWCYPEQPKKKRKKLKHA